MDPEIIGITVGGMAAVYAGITTITNAIYRHHPRGKAMEEEEENYEEEEQNENQDE